MGKRQTKDKIMKKTNTKANPAPAIKWVKHYGYGDDGCWRHTYWLGYTGGKKPVLKIDDIDGDFFLDLLKPSPPHLGIARYSTERASKRGAERFAKRMRELFA